MCARKLRQYALALPLCALIFGSRGAASAQSTWQKMKLQFLEQACKGGDQNSCRQLAQLKQKLAQQPQAQPAEPQAQPNASQSQQPAQPATDVVNGDAAAPAPAAASSGSQEAGSQQAWAPPTTEPAPSHSAGPLDPLKLPDIQGLHPGMTIEQANQAIAKVAPGTRIPWYNSPMIIPTSNIVAGHAASQVTVQYGWVEVGGGAKNYTLELALEATRPPNQEHIWHIGLKTQIQHINRAVLLAALRQKYGKELFATDYNGQLVNDDSRINQLWWAFDEQGHPKSPAPALVNGTPNGCGEPGYGLSSLARYGSGGGTASSSIPGTSSAGKDSDPGCMWVGVHATFPSGAGEIISYYSLSLWDAPLSVREFKVTDAWLQVQLEKARQEALQKSKEAKPVM